MFVYLLRKCVILFCCYLLALSHLSAHVLECVTGKEQAMLRLKHFWYFCWWWANWRSRWLLNTGQRALYTVHHCLVQLWAKIGSNYCCRCYTSTTTPSNRHVTIHSGTTTNCSNLDQWWVICLSIFNWCTHVSECVYWRVTALSWVSPILIDGSVCGLQGVGWNMTSVSWGLLINHISGLHRCTGCRVSLLSTTDRLIVSVCGVAVCVIALLREPLLICSNVLFWTVRYIPYRRLTPCQTHRSLWKSCIFQSCIFQSCIFLSCIFSIPKIIHLFLLAIVQTLQTSSMSKANRNTDPCCTTKSIVDRDIATYSVKTRCSAQHSVRSALRGSTVTVATFDRE